MKSLSRDRASRGHAVAATTTILGAAAVLWAGSAGAAPPPTQHSARYELRDLGALGGTNSAPFSINEFGMVVGWAQTDEGEIHAFLWFDDAMIDLGTLGGAWSEARDVNRHLEIVGASATPNDGVRAVRWFDGGAVDLNDALTHPRIPPSIHGRPFDVSFAPHPTLVDAMSINEQGRIIAVGYHAFDENVRGFLLSPARPFDWDRPQYTYVDLGTLPGAADALPFGLNDHDEVVGSSGNEPFIWSGGEIARLDSSPLDVIVFGQANAINAAGTAAGRTGDLILEWTAAVWQRGARRDLTVAPRWVSEATDLNDTNQVVGWAAPSIGGEGGSPIGLPVAVLWDTGQNTARDLNQITIFPERGPFDWRRLEAATAIDNGGRIVGYGRDSLGNIRAFMLVPMSDDGSE